MRRAFTMIEMLLAVLLVGVITSFSVLVFNAVTGGWQASTDYMDKMQRTDFALTQVITGLRSMYYPHDGKQDYDYGFVLTNNGDGEDPDRSDTIEWSKTGTAIVGNKSAVADTVHRVQVMILEEGDSTFKEPIEVTGLYARQCPDIAIRPKDDDDEDYSFGNDEIYQPVLIADGIVGFNCRVLKNDEKKDKESDESLFEDEWDSSNSVPYKVELTFRIADPEGRSYRSNTAPLLRIVTLPMYAQSQDGATTPDDDAKGGGRSTTGGTKGGGTKGGGGPGGGSRGPGGGAPGGGGGAPPPPGGVR